MIGVNLLQIQKNVESINLFKLYVTDNEGTSQYFILDHDIKSVWIEIMLTHEEEICYILWSILFYVPPTQGLLVLSRM